jgi:prevent-host-death family protein
MKTVSVSELKAHLSKYLREVKRGGEVQVLERGVPVARLVRVQGARRSDPARRERLVRSGILRPGAGNAGQFLRKAPLSLPGANLSAALEEERGDRV